MRVIVFYIGIPLFMETVIFLFCLACKGGKSMVTLMMPKGVGHPDGVGDTLVPLLQSTTERIGLERPAS